MATASTTPAAANTSPMTTDAAVGGAAGQGLGDLIGYFLSQGDRDKARGLIDQSTGMLQGLDPRIAASLAGPSAYNSLSIDPTDRSDQLDALGQLKQIYSNGGMDAQARADTAAATQTADQNSQALNANIRNAMAQRGLASSGANFAMQRANAQNAGNQAAMMGLQAQAAGEQRANNALAAYGGQANALRGQDYQAASDKAAANDAISKFNAGQTQGAQQQTFNNGYQQAQGIGGTAGAYQGMAGQTMQTADGAGKAIGAGIGTLVGSGVMSDERLKTNIRRHGHDVVKGVPLATFEFKHEPGKRYAGVIAQDLKKAAPHLVSEDEDGLMYVPKEFAPVELKGGK